MNTMDFDEKLKTTLEEDEQLQRELLREDSIWTTIGDTFRGNQRYLVMLVFAFTFLFTIALFYCGYCFFTATTLDQRLLYGFLTLMFMSSIAAYKIWYWMEMNRMTIIREVKRLELQIAQLKEERKW